ncbi:MAG: 2-C-methyl-D-erythritol 4-phosphate cytidylyltransferase [Bacteroidales bacterium]|nr:2-C-methyl-D-erythritol 4-phosphate cytidylyltransferase [Bacteroidales bacterium]
MKKYALIMAGGSGTRMAADMPKQFLPLAGRPVLMRTLEVFYQYDPALCLVMVLPAAHLIFWKQLCRQWSFDVPHHVVEGGRERFFSVKNGLLKIQQLRCAAQQPPKAGRDDLVAVHDAVRPLINVDFVGRCYEAASRYGSIVPVLPMTESVRRVAANGESQAEDRHGFFRVQTPQVFRADVLWNAYQQDYRPEFTDDASVVEASGERVYVVNGLRENLKITMPEDMVLAEYWLKGK